MALDITVDGEVETQVKQVVTTNNTRVAGVYFDFTNTASFSSVEFGNGTGDDFVLMKQETWKLSGDYYLNKIQNITQGDPLSVELLSSISDIALDIQSDPVLKGALIYNGELKVINGDVSSMIYGAL